MRFFLTDLRRVFTETAFYISMLLNLLLLGAGMLCVWDSCEAERLFLHAQSFALPFVAPVLAAMPYTVMIMQEKETRYDILMNIKLNGTGYIFRRFITCGISGGMALFIPQAVLLIVCVILCPEADRGYDLTVLLLSLSFGFSYASLSYGLTFVNRQRYVPLVMPQVIYLLCIYAFPHIKLERFYPPLDIAPAIYGSDITPDRIFIPLLITALGLVLAIIGKGGERR